MKIVRVIGILFTLFCWQGVQASPVTFTGAELLNLPAVSFPNGVPAQGAGTSVVFNQPPGSAVLFSFDLTGNPIDISASLNVTRRSGDFDILLAISDGVKAVGGIAADNSGGLLLGEGDITLISSQQIARGNDGPVNDGLGFPALGGSFEVSYDFLVSDIGVDLTFGFFGQSLSFSSPVILDRTRGLSLLLISDGNSSASEIYEINSLTLQNTQVSEPQYLAFFAFSLLGFLIYRKRRL